MSSIINLLASGGGLRPVLILFGFESNSGGQVPDGDATVPELSETENVRILNPTTLLLENLHIGVNQNLDHSGLTPHTTHGWHVGIKNRADALTFVLNPPVYICEFGQGGSALSAWQPGGTYHNKMIARYEAAWDEIVGETGKEPVVFMFNSWGINDALVGTTPSTFKAGYLDLLDQINAIHPVKAYMVDNIFSIFPTYRVVIEEMADDRGNIFIQDMQGLPQADAYHLDYVGMKAMSNLKIDQTIALR